MTLKLHGGWRASVRQSRRLARIPAAKRLGDYIRAGWMKRYKVKNLGRSSLSNGER
jgi:hypothetical protein